MTDEVQAPEDGATGAREGPEEVRSTSGSPKAPEAAGQESPERGKAPAASGAASTAGHRKGRSGKKARRQKSAKDAEAPALSEAPGPVEGAVRKAAVALEDPIVLAEERTPAARPAATRAVARSVAEGSEAAGPRAVRAERIAAQETTGDFLRSPASGPERSLDGPGTNRSSAGPSHPSPRERVLSAAERESFRQRARDLRCFHLDRVASSDLHLLGVGALSPLQGFMDSRDYESVLETRCLADGTPFGLPVVLSVSDADARGLRTGQEVALFDGTFALRGRLVLREQFRRDLTREAESVYGTVDRQHPGVAYLLSQHEHCLAGTVDLFDPPEDRRYGGLALTPLQVRAEIRRRGWRTVVAFQTRDPIHRADEYLTKCALETVDGLLIHPLVGETRPRDVPTPLRLRCYQALLEGYYPPEATLLAVLPAAMRHAGPREALFHARLRANHGCTHFIVGRNDAAVEGYYGPHDAQDLLRQFGSERLGITPICFEDAFYCAACASFASARSCPHGPGRRLGPPGSQVRELLAAREPLPPELVRPEVAELLRGFYAADPSG